MNCSLTYVSHKDNLQRCVSWMCRCAAQMDSAAVIAAITAEKYTARKIQIVADETVGADLVLP